MVAGCEYEGELLVEPLVWLEVPVVVDVPAVPTAPLELVVPVVSVGLPDVFALLVPVCVSVPGPMLPVVPVVLLPVVPVVPLVLVEGVVDCVGSVAVEGDVLVLGVVVLVDGVADCAGSVAVEGDVLVLGVVVVVAPVVPVWVEV